MIAAGVQNEQLDLTELEADLARFLHRIGEQAVGLLGALLIAGALLAVFGKGSRLIETATATAAAPQELTMGGMCAGQSPDLPQAANSGSCFAKVWNEPTYGVHGGRVMASWCNGTPVSTTGWKDAERNST